MLIMSFESNKGSGIKERMRGIKNPPNLKSSGLDCMSGELTSFDQSNTVINVYVTLTTLN